MLNFDVGFFLESQYFDHLAKQFLKEKANFPLKVFQNVEGLFLLHTLLNKEIVKLLLFRENGYEAFKLS